MGGCCCCSSRRADVHNRPSYYYCPEERVPLSSHNRTSSVISSAAVLVDTNLETSFPDAYRPPPLPLPFDAALGHPRTPQRVQEICPDIKRDMSVGPIAHETVATVVLGVPTGYQDEDTDCKLQADIDFGSKEDIDLKFSEKTEDVEEDCCPICLEEYDAENPQLVTQCEHHFHLACILQWMERSHSCPVCDKEPVFDFPLD